MNNITEDDLILYHYGELSEEQQFYISEKLKSEPELQKQYSQLIAVLETTDNWQPELNNDYFNNRLWQNIEPQLDSFDKSFKAEKVSVWKKFNDWVTDWIQQPIPAFAMIFLLVAVAYITGRSDLQQEIIDNPEQMIASLSVEARNKILFQSVDEHLEKSSRLLKSVSLNDSDNRVIDKTEQLWSRQLLNSNRLFMKAAEQAGQWRIVKLLSELEPILIEMANSDETAYSNRQQIQERIESNKLVFKTKAFKSAPSENI